MNSMTNVHFVIITFMGNFTTLDIRKVIMAENQNVNLRNHS